MAKALKWIKARLKEPSTYAGLGTILTVAGARELGIQVTQVGQGLALILGGLVAHRAFDSTE